MAIKMHFPLSNSSLYATEVINVSEVVIRCDRSQSTEKVA